MSRLVLTAEQAGQVDSPGQPTAVYNEDGGFLGYFEMGGFSPEEIENVKRSMNDKNRQGYSTSRILEFLAGLEETEQERGPLTKELVEYAKQKYIFRKAG